MRMAWGDWLASRAAKREALRRHGLDAPSRRNTSWSTSERRMRNAFGGARIPQFAVSAAGEGKGAGR